MIELHKLSTTREPFQLNVDLIERIDASPDCHVTLTTGQRIAVTESVDEVVAQDPRLARRRHGARAAPRTLTAGASGRSQAPSGTADHRVRQHLPTWSTHA